MSNNIRNELIKDLEDYKELVSNRNIKDTNANIVDFLLGLGWTKINLGSIKDE